MAHLERALVLVAVLMGSACGDDGAGGGGERGEVPASAADCKKAKKIASDCGNMVGFDCDTDKFAVECAIEYPKAYCSNDGDFFACVYSKANDYYRED